MPTIRPATIEDMDHLIDLAARLGGEDGDQYGEAVNVNWAHEGGRESFTRSLETPTSCVLVANIDGEVRGSLHGCLRPALPTSAFRRALGTAGRSIPFIIAVLVVQIFAANVAVIAGHVSTFVTILAAVFVFFTATWVMGEWLSGRFGLPYADHALLAMTTAARNAPLMLGVTVAAMPDQPLVHAAIVMGMLVEFPHLTILAHLLPRRRARFDGIAPQARRAQPEPPVRGTSVPTG